VFASLPLHAAGEYTSSARRWECCSDYVVSSYIPTCTALLTARKAFKPVRIKDVRALLAGAPRPFEGPALQGAAIELRKISDFIPTEQCITLPASDDTVLDSKAGISTHTLLQKLPEASVLHLACHGKQFGDNPLESGFILRDAKITIAQLMPVPLPNAFLAFLSACETARTDQDQTDQVIHLAATMLFAGFKSVIGTMW
jgi:CHAT domain-containing protein